ncbi:MAG: pyrroloquinoline quinone biosynthesis protein PqqD [Desulfuromonadaceae bacterium GWC2_58_13]|nr:MAG: pyrroloquinoline quinone biosynthesis protein PqqD [Desulfuromonadaceae bacterium GWC2_58_13]
MKNLSRNPDIVWRVEKRREAEIIKALDAGEDVSDKGSVILIVSGMMHQLNLVGGRIWTLCDGQRSLDDLVEALSGEFEVERGELTGDVEAFVDDLLKRGWLKYA